jgi:ATP-dependent helicase HrpB
VKFAPARLRELHLDINAVRAVERVSEQLRRLCKSRKAAGDKSVSALSSSVAAASSIARLSSVETHLLISILAGYPDRVARRRVLATEANERSVEVLLAGGGAGVLAPSSVVRQSLLLVAVDAEESRSPGKERQGRSHAGTIIRLASAIEPEWLLDLFADNISETTSVEWNAVAERVEVVRRLLYDELVLDESRNVEAGSSDVSSVLAEAALEAGVQAFVEREPVDRFLARVAFLAETFPEAGWPTLGEEDVRESLFRLCEGRRSFAELREAARAGGLLSELRRRLNAEQSRRLATLAPERVTLAGGRQAKVNYENGKMPWLASRLQDFFGMREGPKVAGGRVAVVLHLLAPNGRPVQVTQDLAGFWTRHYPQVRRELSRRYPRHAWPEEGI